MSVLSNRVGIFFGWQWLVLVGLFSLVSIGVFTLAQSRESTAQIGPGQGEQIVVAQITDLIDSVSTSGTVIFPNRETVSFEISGDVGVVLVAEGAIVRPGQALASIDDATLASLQEDVAQAKITLQKVTEDLETALARPDEAEIAKANHEVNKSRLALQDAEDALADINEITATERATAQDALAQAEVALANATSDLAAAKRTAAENNTDTQASLTNAQVAYAEVFTRWLGIHATNVEPNSNPDSLFAGWKVDLESLFDDRAVLGANNRSSAPDDDPETAWNEATVYSWLTLFPGQVIGICNDGAPHQGVCAEQEIDETWDELTDARTSVETTALEGSKSVLKAEEALSKAEQARESAEEALSDLLSPDALVRDLAVTKVKTAEIALTDAQEVLTETQGGLDELDLQLLQAQQVVAKEALVSAKIAVSGATLVAPIAGIVETLSMAAGDRANQQNVFLEIVDQSTVEIDGSVDEIDVLSIQEGLAVSVQMTALPDQSLAGTIDEIGSADAGQGGVVTFPIKIRLNVPEGLALREGLSATSEIVIDQYRDVLVVPTSSVSGSFLAPVVRVATAQGIQERPVQLGPSDDFWVVVIAGLLAGEQVLMPEPASSETRFGGFRGLLGGGRGGLGGGQAGRGGGQGGRGGGQGGRGGG